MANTYSQVYVQCVFAVKYRQAIIHKEWRQTLLGVIGNLINETGCKTIIVNGVEDHVHCFIGLKPILSISEQLTPYHQQIYQLPEQHLFDKFSLFLSRIYK